MRVLKETFAAVAVCTVLLASSAQTEADTMLNWVGSSPTTDTNSATDFNSGSIAFSGVGASTLSFSGAGYIHAHSGSVTGTIQVDLNNSWTTVGTIFSNTSSGNPLSSLGTISFAHGTITGVRLTSSPAQNQSYHNFGTETLDFGYGYANAIYQALNNPAQTLNFDDLSGTAHDAPVTSLNGVTFSNFYNSEAGAAGAFGPTDPNFIGNFQSNVAVNPNSYISFAAPVDQAAFRLYSQTGTTTFTAYLNNQIVGQYTAATGTNLSSYYGFQGVTFDKIGISIASSDNAFLVDDLQFGTAPALSDPTAAPLPSTVWAGLGLLGCIGAFKLRRKRVAA